MYTPEEEAELRMVMAKMSRLKPLPRWCIELREMRAEMRARQVRKGFSTVGLPFNLLDGPMNFMLLLIELMVKRLVSHILQRKLPRP
jgi:hypothetical protein